MESLFLKSFQWYAKLTNEIELMKIYGLLPAALSHQSRTSIAALHSLLHVPCSWTPTRQPSNPKPNPWGKNSQEKKDLYINFQIFSFALETVV